MFTKRATAAKLAIHDIQEGELTANEQGNVVGVKTYLGPVSRVNIIATVVDRFVATQERLTEEGRGFATLTLDDGTGVIRVKLWGDLSAKSSEIQIGDLALVVGKIRSFQGETYINGEIVRKLDDPNWEALRLAELALSRKEPHKLQERIEPSEFAVAEETEAPTSPRQVELEPGVWHNATATIKQYSEEEEEPIPSPELRRLVLLTIEKFDSEGGARFEQILDAAGDIDEEVVEQTLIDLLSEGVVYEPEIHRYKKS